MIFMDATFSFEKLDVYKKQTACDLGYIKEGQLDTLRPQFTDIAKMLSGLRNTLNKKLDNK